MATVDLRDGDCSRRDFITVGLAAGLLAGAAPLRSLAALAAPADKVPVWVIHGPSKARLMQKAFEIMLANGGLGAAAKKLTLKVNAGWARTPEQGANTHPELVDVFLQGCRAAGVRNIVLPEMTCNSSKIAFEMSGILAAAKKNRADLIDIKEQKDYVTAAVPGGRILKTIRIGRDFLETDVLVNMPVAKHHGGATLSMAMKNWMGATPDRGAWHKDGLHQCIADFATFIQPRWTIIDATRTMMDSGPQGPSKVLKTPDLLIVSRDQVAADAFATSLFHSSIDPVGYLKIAREMKIGVTDQADMNIQRIET